MPDNDSFPINPQDQNSDDWLKAAGAGLQARLDAQAKLARVDAPERVSPDLFNVHVTPDLDAVIRAWACFIRLNMADYTEAIDACLGYAWRRGAWGFNPAHLADLQDWIADTLRDAIGEW